ncbi:hypothetical protein N431DRAFT_488883 [Stipitochalara longipes BDJ]|nr:hypothetical protein N431DRAFT_488883 [Stipitochalara longipes BDJ]
MMKTKKITAIERASIEQASIEREAKETSWRKSCFLRATQSDRITVLIGPSQKSFQVPQDLLMQWAPALGKAYQSGFEESRTRTILLPHVKMSTFEEFLIWLHAYEPSVDLKKLASVLDLAIFAEMYIICHLKNQTSDILRAELGSGRWQLTPDDVAMVYDDVPSGSILRQLCSVSFALAAGDPPSYSGFGHPSGFGGLANTHKDHSNYMEWKSVFETHSDLGWDYFKQIQTGYAQTSINGGGACRFHDHRDIRGAGREGVDKCPYPHGALPTKRHARSQPNENQGEKSVEAQPVGNDVQEQVQPVLQGPLEEPLSVEEAHPIEEQYSPVEEVAIAEEEPQPVQEVLSREW